MRARMKVRVKLHGETKRGVRGLEGDSLEAEVAPGTTVGELLDGLGIDPGDVWLSAVNKDLVKADHVLQDGDAVEVFAPVAGG